MNEPSRVPLAQELARTAASAFGWWTGELAGLLPSRLRRDAPSALIVEPDLAGLLVGRTTETGWETLARFEAGAPGRWAGPGGAAAADAILQLPTELVLRRTVTLAAAAAENLHEVVGFQLDRYTPFEIDEVFLGCRIVGRDPLSETIDVALAVAPRADVAALIEAAASRGIACTRVQANDGCGLPLALEIGRSEERAPPTRWRRAVWLAAILLLAANIGLPLLQNHGALVARRQELATARREAQVVAELRDAVDAASEQATLPVKRWERPPLSALLTEITHLIPDNGWVTQMQVDANTIQLTGFAMSANGLVPVLEQSQLFANAAFRSPVTQDPVHGVEQFHLSVDLRRHGE